MDYAECWISARHSLKRVYEELLKDKPERAMESAQDANKHLLDLMLAIRQQVLDKRKS